MFSCLAVYNNVCVTCIWCMLLSTCYSNVLGALRDNSRKDVPRSDGKISSLLEYSLGSVDGKVSFSPDDPKGTNYRRITISRPPLKETE